MAKQTDAAFTPVKEATPKITKQRAEGASVWLARLAPLKDDPDEFYRLNQESIENPHQKAAQIRNSMGDTGDEFEVVARNVPTGGTTTDKDGNEVPETEGFVYARWISDEGERADLAAKRRERAEKTRATRAANKDKAKAKS